MPLDDQSGVSEPSPLKICFELTLISEIPAAKAISEIFFAAPSGTITVICLISYLCPSRITGIHNRRQNEQFMATRVDDPRSMKSGISLRNLNATARNLINSI